MENSIPQDKLAKLASKTDDIIEIVNDGVTWVNQALGEESRASTNYQIKAYRRKLKKIREVVTEKPTVALFGASQVGKSYMANNLLYNEYNKLEVFNHQTGEKIDFIKYINPEGKGNEATAPITRFTANMITDTGKLPVKIRLFSPMDIACILCDTYYYDFNDKKPMPDKEAIQEFMSTIQDYKGTTKQSFIDDDNIYEIKEYLEKYFFKNAFVLNLENIGFWDILAENIAYINSNQWTKVFEILWNNHSEISKVFTMVIEYLAKFKFSKEVHVGFDAVERKGENSIISVQTLLKGFYNDNHKSFQVQLEDGQTLEASSAKLCFITSEVVLSVAEGTTTNRPFIKNVDIIDFPGARSRPEIHDLSEKSVLEMLLRGKVSYLFNLYSLNYKSNTLSVCMRTQQTNVTTVPRLVNQWIEDNLGKNPEERAKNLSNMPIHPLFVIFTWWNTQFLFKKATDDPDPTERIQKLFETRFKEEVKGSYNWNENWIKRNGNISRFTNFYLLRDFKESTEIFSNKEEDDVEITDQNLLFDNGRNTLYDDTVPFFKNNDQKKFHKDYYTKFVGYHNEKNQFFANPEEAFLESSIPGKDGSEYIIKNLIPVASNTVSVPIYINVLNDALESAKTELQKHYHSDDADEQIKQAARYGSDIQLSMSVIFGKDAFYFGHFIECLCISENEILEFYHILLQNRQIIDEQKINAYTLIKAENPTLSPEKSYQDNVNILKLKYNFSSVEETENHFQNEKKIDLNELFYGNLHDLQNSSMTLAEAARDYWVKTKLDSDKFSFFTEKGLDNSLLIKLFSNLITSFDELKMTRIIADSIREFVDRIDKVDEAEDMIAHITAGHINEFINSVGWSYYSQEDKVKICEAKEENQLNIVLPTDTDVFSSLERTEEEVEGAEMSLEKLIDFMDNLNEELNKTPMDTQTLKYAPMVKNYQRWAELMRVSFIANCDIPNYDIEANKKLGEILDKMKEYSFFID